MMKEDILTKTRTRDGRGGGRGSPRGGRGIGRGGGNFDLISPFSFFPAKDYLKISDY